MSLCRGSALNGGWFSGRSTTPSPSMSTPFVSQQSGIPSRSVSTDKSQGTGVGVGVGVAVGVGVGVGDGAVQLFRRIDTLSDPAFATARSNLPSPLKSPALIDGGDAPAAKLVA